MASVEIHFAQRLAANDATTRARTLRRLRKWMAARSGSASDFNEEDMLKIWKGLFYCMWMSDKPLVQEELAESISRIIHCLRSTTSTFLYIDCFFTTMAREWHGLDRLRMDKFMMFIRKFWHQCLLYLRNSKWKDDLVQQMSETLERMLLRSSASVPLGLQLHLADVYVEELAKVSESITPEQANTVLEPFCKVMADTQDATFLANVVVRIFEFVMRLSDVGLDEEPEEEEEEEEIVSVVEQEVPEEEDTTKKKKKKRKSKYKHPSYASLVRGMEREAMELPYIRFDYSALADRLFALASGAEVKQRNRMATYRLVEKFRVLAKGVFPLNPKMPGVGRGLGRKEIEAAAQRLFDMRDNEQKETRNWNNQRWAMAKRMKRRLGQEEEDDSEDDDGLAELDDDDDDEESLELDAEEIPAPTKSNNSKKVDRKRKNALKGSQRETGDNSILKNKCKKLKTQKKSRQTSEAVTELSLETTNHITAVVDSNERRLDTSTIGHASLSEKSRKDGSKEGKSKPEKGKKRSLEKRLVKKSPKSKISTTQTGQKLAALVEVKRLKFSSSPVNGTVVFKPNKLKDRGVKSKKESSQLAKSTAIPKEVFASFEKFIQAPPAFARKAVGKVFPKREVRQKPVVPVIRSSIPTGSKKVNFILSKNSAQDASDYQEKLKSSLYVPFDGSKRPPHGVLKLTP